MRFPMNTSSNGRRNLVMLVSYYLHKFLKLYVSQTKEMSQLQKQPSEVSIEKAVLKNFAIFMGKHLRHVLFLIELQVQAWPATVLKGTLTKGFSVNIGKILRRPIFKKICKQLLLQFLLLTVKNFSLGFRSALNSISLFSSRSSLRVKGFSLGCLVVDSSLIWKKEELAEMATRCHLLSFVVTWCVTRLSFYKRSLLT